MIIRPNDGSPMTKLSARRGNCSVDVAARASTAIAAAPASRTIVLFIFILSAPLPCYSDCASHTYCNNTTLHDCSPFGWCSDEGSTAAPELGFVTRGARRSEHSREGVMHSRCGDFGALGQTRSADLRSRNPIGGPADWSSMRRRDTSTYCQLASSR